MTQISRETVAESQYINIYSVLPSRVSVQQFYLFFLNGFPPFFFALHISRKLFSPLLPMPHLKALFLTCPTPEQCEQNNNNA